MDAMAAIDDRSSSRRKTVVEGKVDWKKRPAVRGKHGGLLVSFFAVAFYGCDMLVTAAVAFNLVEYLINVMHLEVADSSNQVTNFLGTLCILTLPLGYLADSYIGRFKIAIIGGFAETVAMALFAVQAHFSRLKPPPCDPFVPTSTCSKVNGGNAAMLYISLYLMALSSAAVKTGAPPHGADQFDEKDRNEARQMSSYFNWLYLGEAVGGFIALAGVVELQDDVSWSWGFIVSAAVIFLGTLLFSGGVPLYRINPIKKGDDPGVDLLKISL